MNFLNPSVVFVGGISWKAMEQDLKECFAQYGAVVDVKIIRDKGNNNQSKGYGFVEFVNEQDAVTVKKLGFVTLLGKQMNVGDAYRGGTRGNTEPLYHTPTLPVFYAYPAAAAPPPMPHMPYHHPYAAAQQQPQAFDTSAQQQQQQAMYIPAAYMNYYMPPLPLPHQFQHHFVQQQQQGNNSYNNNNARKEPATQ